MFTLLDKTRYMNVYQEVDPIILASDQEVSIKETISFIQKLLFLSFLSDHVFKTTVFISRFRILLLLLPFPTHAFWSIFCPLPWNRPVFFRFLDSGRVFFSLPGSRFVFFPAPCVVFRSLDSDSLDQVTWYFFSPWTQICVFSRFLDPYLFISAPWICIFSTLWIQIRIFRSVDLDPPWIKMRWDPTPLKKQKKNLKN